MSKSEAGKGDLAKETPESAPVVPPKEEEWTSQPSTALVAFPKEVPLDQHREQTRGDLARGLLWLLAFSIGGVLVFIGNSRLEGAVLTQSVFPSLIALTGTALGFYFGAQSAKGNGNAAPTGIPPKRNA